MTMTIRGKAPDDVDALHLLWAASVRATHHFLSAADFAEISALVRDRYLPAAALDVAVDAGDRPLGFLGMSGTHIDALFVDPAVHGRGIGRALVAYAAARAPVLSVDVNEQNEGAVAFYGRLGFRRTGRSPTDDEGRPYPLLHLRAG